MTSKARALGMTRTTFRNASGLPNRKQRSTARDMAQLARALMRDFPHRYHYFDDERFATGERASHAQQAAGSLPRHGRYKDRLHPGLGVQPRGVGGTRRPRVVAVVFGGKTSALAQQPHDQSSRPRLHADRRARRRTWPRPLCGHSAATGRLRPGRADPRFKPAAFLVAAAQPLELVEGAAAPPAEPIESAEAVQADVASVPPLRRPRPPSPGLWRRLSRRRRLRPGPNRRPTRSRQTRRPPAPGAFRWAPTSRSRQLKSPCAGRRHARPLSTARQRRSNPVQWVPATSIERAFWGSTRATPSGRARCFVLRPCPASSSAASTRPTIPPPASPPDG